MQPPVTLARHPRTAPPAQPRCERGIVDDIDCLSLFDVDAMDDFFMSIVSDSDHFLFIDSKGCATAGRGDPDHAVFPYHTVDKIMAHVDSQGGMSAFLVDDGDARRLWQPWHDSARIYRIRRNCHKSIGGEAVCFEEINEDLGLTLRCWWSTCEPYGFVRRCLLVNHGAAQRHIAYADGVQRLIPPGVSQDMWERRSYLAQAYFRHECDPATALATYSLNAAISDRAEPQESLRCAVAWSIGHHDPAILLSTRSWQQVLAGAALPGDDDVRGCPGAYLAQASVTLAPTATHEWFTVVDTGLDHARLDALRAELSQGLSATTLLDAMEANRSALHRRLAQADALQDTADDRTDVHHYANVLFNCMRGGTFGDGHRIERDDFLRFIEQRNRACAERQAEALAAWPAQLDRADWLRMIAERDDADLTRLAECYLPLSFSRRHGDPSRPWNRFRIRIRDEHGQEIRDYQGNWRDIFQNWEALAQSFPAWLPQMIATFLAASTADGSNPYRVTRAGFDWEVMDPDDPWSFIGYWGDHQLIYLLRLLESQVARDPAFLGRDLDTPRHPYADVPYRIRSYADLRRDPRDSIAFDEAAHEAALARQARIGGDGLLLPDESGQPRLAGLGEKLLLPLLVKVANLVPGGGIWMNTQRPEWNDANNALVGWGLSVVTTCAAHRYASFLVRHWQHLEGLTCSAALADLAADIAQALERLPHDDDPAARRSGMDALQAAAQRHRDRVYRGAFGNDTCIDGDALRDLLHAIVRCCEATIRANRRDDGLYHGYNILELDATGAHIRHLDLMLEGQVAVLSTRLLEAAEVLRLLRALRDSPLYRADQHSYLLYPQPAVRSFAERNRIPREAVAGNAALREALAGRIPGVLRAGVDPALVHFDADLRNARDLRQRLAEADCREADIDAACALWEQHFRHRRFTGRSGTFFAFEGLGCIYWHMVAKLLLAVQEQYDLACQRGSDAAVIRSLAEWYHDIRDGLGFRRDPASYGAFPTDPYSHTPAHAGAQQPGMTGQVKEEILTRWGELGIGYDAGQLRFRPRLLRREEFDTAERSVTLIGIAGSEQPWSLPAQSIAFTCAQVPVCYRLGATAGIEVAFADGRSESIADDRLPPALTDSVTARDGRIARLTVTVPAEQLIGTPA